MTDIKVLSRDGLMKLIEGLPIEIISKDQCRSSGTPFYRSEGIDRINDEEDGAANRLGWRVILALMDAYEKPAPKCAGYPTCDGNLVGLGHDEGCPLYKPTEPAPKWEPGMVLKEKHGSRILRLDKHSGPLLSEPEPYTWSVAPFNFNEEYNELLMTILPGEWEIHRLPHEFKVGDWAESVRDTGKPFKVCAVVAHEPSVMAFKPVGGGPSPWYYANDCRHVPPPKEEKPSQERQVMPNETTNVAVTGAHRVAETSEKPILLKLDRYQRDNLLWLLRLCLEGPDEYRKADTGDWCGELRNILEGTLEEEQIKPNGFTSACFETSEKPYWDSQVLCDVPATLNAAMERTADLNRRLEKLEQVEVGEKPFTGSHWFSEQNRARCESPEGFRHKLSDWDTSDWFLAILGELGEAANNAKKLNRVRDGIPGNKENPEELRSKLRKELGDTYVYLDLLCQSLGFYAIEAAVDVFDEKSREIGYPVDLRDELNRMAGR